MESYTGCGPGPTDTIRGHCDVLSLMYWFTVELIQNPVVVIYSKLNYATDVLMTRHCVL